MGSPERQVVRRYGIILAVLYFPMVGGLALLKATTPLFAGLPWPEVIYGPALTFGSCFLLFFVACWIEHRIRGNG
jgi:hypothetical protein